MLAKSWSSGMFDATARVNYFSSITSFNSSNVAVGNPTRQKFGADVSVDLEYGITFSEKYRFAVGSENILDAYPDREVRNIYAATGAQASGRVFNDASPLSYMGGFWYVRGSVTF